jgi:hypothetical protein
LKAPKYFCVFAVVFLLSVQGMSFKKMELSKNEPCIKAEAESQGFAISEDTKNRTKTVTMVGWNVPEQVIREQAYKLWESGHSSDSMCNWVEAERIINEAVSK